jgi:hypothetical protein
MKRILCVCLLVFGLILSWTLVYAGDFYVIPVKGKFTSWDKKISGSSRFKLVLDGNAALDRETGLVWDKSPDTSEMLWTSACIHCYQREVGGRKGWRLPTIEELASLVDTSQSNPALPAGHPFTNVQSYYYWSSSTGSCGSSYAWAVNFISGLVPDPAKSHELNVWCVRGGYGHDAY